MICLGDEEVYCNGLQVTCWSRKCCMQIYFEAFLQEEGGYSTDMYHMGIRVNDSHIHIVEPVDDKAFSTQDSTILFHELYRTEP